MQRLRNKATRDGASAHSKYSVTQKYFCLDKSNFVSTKVILYMTKLLLLTEAIFVNTKLLLSDKSNFVYDKITFV